MPLVEREEIIEALSKTFSKIKHDKKIVNQIKEKLTEYEINPGNSQAYINNPQSALENEDLRLVCLLMQIGFEVTKSPNLFPKTYFTDSEIQASKQYSGELEREDSLTLPLAFSNVTIVGNGVYMVTMSIQTIKKLIDSKLLNYNFETQREATFRRVKDKIIIEPTVNQNSVKEISQHLREGTLVPTVLTFNAATRTALSGNELIYDHKKQELTITEGTRLDIIDGYHRCMGLQNALAINPNIDFNFAVMITNYSTKKAQQFLAQIAKANPMSKTRIQELAASRLSDDVVQILKEDSELKGRISSTHHVHTLNNEIVTYSVLADTIEEEFELKTKAEAMDLGDYLTDFFNYLIGTFSEEFITNVEETKKNSLINDNNMFIGYLILAKRMQEKGIKYRKIKDIVKNIDFSKENSIWEELGILENGKINTGKARKGIKKYFNELEIEELLEV